MKSRLVCCCLALLFIVHGAGPCFGQSETNHRSMSTDQVITRVTEAHAKKKQLTVMLKNGSIISGKVSPQSAEMFSVTRTYGMLGDGEELTIRYSDVARIKGVNAFVKTLKDIGTGSLLVVGVAAFLPVWALFQGLSLLINGEPLSGC